MSGLETDGPYGGEPCAASHHKHHRGLADSVFFQTRLQERFYHRMRAGGVPARAGLLQRCGGEQDHELW